MEAPQKGLSLQLFVKTFDDYLTEKCKRINEETYFCKKCNSQIEQTICFVSFHQKEFSGCVGRGQSEEIPLPFCRKCEGEPKNTKTCVHD